tara:strand:- start:162 stop:446 length:285 start_codon:yes stop_codon:yes gene_type:complete
MKKAKIFVPSKTATQSGKGKSKKWILKFDTRHGVINPLMGWESSDDTMGEITLEFNTKKEAINYAKNNNIQYDVIEPKKSDYIIKSYSDNFLKE